MVLRFGCSRLSQHVHNQPLAVTFALTYSMVYPPGMMSYMVCRCLWSVRLNLPTIRVYAFCAYYCAICGVLCIITQRRAGTKMHKCCLSYAHVMVGQEYKPYSTGNGNTSQNSYFANSCFFGVFCSSSILLSACVGMRTLHPIRTEGSCPLFISLYNVCVDRCKRSAASRIRRYSSIKQNPPFCASQDQRGALRRSRLSRFGV